MNPNAPTSPAMQTEESMAQQFLTEVSSQAKRFLAQGINTVNERIGTDKTLALIHGMDAQTRALLLAAVTQPVVVIEPQIATQSPTHIAKEAPQVSVVVPSLVVAIESPTTTVAAFRKAIQGIPVTGQETAKRLTYENVVLASLLGGLTIKEIQQAFPAGTEHRYIENALSELRRKKLI